MFFGGTETEGRGQTVEGKDNSKDEQDSKESGELVER